MAKVVVMDEWILQLAQKRINVGYKNIEMSPYYTPPLVMNSLFF